MINEDEEDGASITTLSAHEAYQEYLGLAYHMVDEDEAFERAEEEATSTP
jgi:hypothetical protein